MPVFKDQIGNSVFLSNTPKRIISVVPSQTELLFYLGLDQELIGITKFCVHPADKVKSVAKVGGTKQLNIPLIHQLKPDLIIANKEENEQSQIEELMAYYPVWISDINNLEIALQMITQIGEVVARTAVANNLVVDISRQFNYLKSADPALRAAYFIWRAPYMIAGTDTFINHLMGLCGFRNAFEEGRYPQVSAEEIVAANPGVVLLSSEPYPFADKHIAEFNKLLPHARIMLVDGELFSWYGNRLLQAPAYFNSLINTLQ
ncbi:helical backbone metal receptor [Mucilaginibacter segetis]|uniref:ABC transporter substrate-binding protein n=1 Tax=Mucilaginibacter segetis TaxID=2793071 RepID=A0A934PXA6_9SPHI|nr:helical backbone metal receptor [Mucilaginibacter segetis]MBK0381151.1 ABC transporter substrate-binding protein [Mucilaginibacter segetis]